MFAVKRTWIVVAVLVVGLSSLSVLSVSAANQSADHEARAQQTGGAWLGVGVETTDDGVLIRQVAPSSPAEDAGLREGDVITAIDGSEITTVEALIDAIGVHQPGDQVTLTVVWRGESREVEVTLAERPADEQLPQVEVRPGFQGVLNFMGLNAEWTEEGLVVKSIDADSPLVDSGLQEGDVITAINGEELGNSAMPRDWMRLFRMETDPLTFTVKRGDETLELEVTLDWANLDMDMMPFEPGMMGRGMQLGVRFQVITPELADEKGLSVTEGALVAEVYDGTPAADAGLQVDDVITAVNGEPVDQERTLADRLVAYEEGDVVTLSVLRGGESLDVEVTLAARGMMGFGPGMMNGMGWFQMDPEHGRFFGGMMPDFFEIHPFMGGQHGGMQFRFGQPDTVPAPDASAPADAAPGSAA
jgi:S1-C subfamily serine protease